MYILFVIYIRQYECSFPWKFGTYTEFESIKQLKLFKPNYAEHWLSCLKQRVKQIRNIGVSGIYTIYRTAESIAVDIVRS